MFIEVESIKYHVQTRGNGKPLVCLHGFSEDISTWDLFCLEGYQLVLIDLIGHGKSDKPKYKKYYRLQTIQKHLHILIHQLGFDKYSILGYSMGGRIALAYALTYLKEVEMLILESTTYGECGWISRMKRRSQDIMLAMKIKCNGIDWFNTYWGDLQIFQSQKMLSVKKQVEIKNRRLRNVPFALANTLLENSQGKVPCLKNQIKVLPMPILYISGEIDEKYTQMGADFQKRNLNIEHKIINQAGHNTHIEDNQAFINIIEKHVKGMK